MEANTLHIPFIHNNKKGLVEVKQEENSNPIQSGCDIILEQFNLDTNIFIGYPTMHAYFKEFEGFGITKYCGWIQVITLEFYSSGDADIPMEIVTHVDVTPNMHENGTPFCGYGYPADIYDAPCNNFSDCVKLKWIADTFLVSMPSFLNDEKISYIAGFRWGYQDSHSEHNHLVELLPIKTIDADSWNCHLQLLKQDFPKWNFV